MLFRQVRQDMRGTDVHQLYGAGILPDGEKASIQSGMMPSRITKRFLN
jgi:hypothetical protein